VGIPRQERRQHRLFELVAGQAAGLVIERLDLAGEKQRRALEHLSLRREERLSRTEFDRARKRGSDERLELAAQRRRIDAKDDLTIAGAIATGEFLSRLDEACRDAR